MTPKMNSLAEAISPYLRQHADNPVHWQQWTPEAMAEAAVRNVPILLSVGYAACHWCHVMAHESFADPGIAAVMNAHFVCVKVDREERPDIDAVYMNATMALTGRGGWPMTCFLTPDGRPFYCGTYFPKEAFGKLLAAISQTWRTRREEVERASNEIAGELHTLADRLPGDGPPMDPMLCDDAVAAILRDEDTVHGGFGGAPKFPPSALMETLLRHHERTGDQASLTAVARVGAAMARGGIYDQLAGGFARYSVDNAWVVPHFEKMLYDNALLLRAYAHWARRTQDPLARRIAAETAEFLRSELADGPVFVSSLDADAAGREGASYVWTPGQLAEVLGPDDAAWAAGVFDVAEPGTFERGASVLQLRADPDDADRLARVRAALLADRNRRPQPARDDKIVTAWNGLAITALGETAVALDDPVLIEAARDCAETIIDRHLVNGRLRRTSLGGVVGDSAGILEDYGALATGLLLVHQLTGERRWLDEATGLLDTALAHFADPHRAGRWYDTIDDAERLVLRPADPMDGATPSGASLITAALLTGAHLTDEERSQRYRQAADDALQAHAALVAQAPRSAGHWLAVGEAAVRGPLQIAVACAPGAACDSTLLWQARRMAPGGAIVVGGAADSAPLLAGRDRIGGADAAYVCRGRVCDRPVVDVVELAAAVGVSA